MMRCDFDAPIEERVLGNFLLSLRWQFIQWHFEKAYIKMNTDEGVMKARNKEVLKVWVWEGEFKLERLNKDWERWKELRESNEFKEVRKKPEDSIKRSKEEKTKVLEKAINEGAQGV